MNHTPSEDLLYGPGTHRTYSLKWHKYPCWLKSTGFNDPALPIFRTFVSKYDISTMFSVFRVALP